ncbi:MAG: viologen exporter family transport system permease protein [Actinomycetota bacterium]|nr:viologen exporter family transport system permease protein [Actinomycetota bacterium]
MRGTVAVLRAAMRDATARRAAFWWQISVMVANDLIWVLFWMIFFTRVPSVRGWDSEKVLLLFAVLTTGSGLALGILANCRRIPVLVREGALDEVLTLPVSPLRHLLVSRVDTVNLGDTVFGVVLFLAVGRPTPLRAAVFVAGVLLSTALLASFLVLIGCAVFVTGDGESSGLGTHAILVLSSYPADIFQGATKMLLYTVVPAGFVASVPARLIDRPDLTDAAALVLITGIFAALAWTAFTLGLHRYASGSGWRRS